MPNLVIGKCCGSCKHVNKPKKPNDTHAPHYAVAKTERWCYKFNIPTVREAYCEEGYELPAGRCAAKTNLGRAMTQFNRQQRIKDVIAWMISNKVERIPYYSKYYENGKEPYSWYIIINGELKVQDHYFDARPSYISVKHESDIERMEEAVKLFKEGRKE